VLWELEFSKCQQLKNNLVVIKVVNILGECDLARRLLTTSKKALDLFRHGWMANLIPRGI
jgi:hypothetical protein